jgi:protein associated with RNAse G/E
MIPILMKHHNYDLQTAVDFVGLMCMHALANFNEDEEKLKKFPFSKGVDEMVRKYVDGLRNWIVGMSSGISYHVSRHPY